MAKTFILGVGAQRTGSTWLYAQLNKNKQINMGFRKEYHVFDVLFTPYFPGYKSKLLEKIELEKEPGRTIENELKMFSFIRKLFEKIGLRKEAGRGVENELKLLSFINDPENYFNYFDGLYRRDSYTEVVGDITPSYSMLDAQAFHFIRAGLEKRGFHIKVIFMMRDPVERIWSMVHQEAKVKKALNSSLPIHTRQFNISNLIEPEVSMRTRYDRTVTELEKAFPKQDIFYGLYENFFNPASYAKLGQFLDMELQTPEFDTRRNVSLMKGLIQPDLAADVAKHYSATYDFVSSRFGAQVRDLWLGFQYLDSAYGGENLKSS